MASCLKIIGTLEPAALSQEFLLAMHGAAHAPPWYRRRSERAVLACGPAADPGAMLRS